VIVSVKFEDARLPGTFTSKPYHYKTALPLAPGDIVVLPTKNGEGIGMVIETMVPESKVDERVMPLLREITQKYPPVPVQNDSSGGSTGCASAVSPFLNR